MLALRNQRYLQELGITPYVSRYTLPGAAQSRRLALVAAIPLPAKELPIRQSKLVPKPKIDTPPAGSKQSPAPATEAPTLAVGHSFSMAVVVGGGWIWLDEAEPGTISSDYFQLFKSLLFALGRSEEGFQAHEFTWPVHNNQQLDLSPEAARDALVGFVGRLLASSPCEGVVIMGDNTAARFDIDQLGFKQQVATVSAWRMMQQPELKKTAWLDLQGLRQSP